MRRTQRHARSENPAGPLRKERPRCLSTCPNAVTAREAGYLPKAEGPKDKQPGYSGRMCSGTVVVPQWMTSTAESAVAVGK
jgi:hypothetical protein